MKAPRRNARRSHHALSATLAAVSLGACSADLTDVGSETDGGSSTCAGPGCVRYARCEPGQASAQFVAQTALPDSAAPSSRFAMQVTFVNCSGIDWHPDEVSLVPVEAEEGNAWGVRRVGLPAAVPNAAQVTFVFELHAPLATGVYPARWAVSRDRVELFQEHTPTQTVRVLAPADCTQAGARVRFRAQQAPPEFIGTGRRVRTSVTFSNCDTVTLTRADGWDLASLADPTDTWGPSRVELPNDVPSGAEVTFDLDLTAPSRPGRYRYAWQIEHHGEAVGEASPTLRPVVLDPADCDGATTPARFVSQRPPPGTVDPNQGFDVRATFANCGDATWDDRYRLDGAAADVARAWGAGPIELPLPVARGFSIDVPFHVRAPGAPGRYPYRWRITSPNGALEEPSPAMDLTVRCIPQCGGHNCGGDGCGGSCGSCSEGWSCDGAHCQPPDRPVCGLLQWWNSYITYEHISSGWHDTDLGVRSGTQVQLRHTSRLERTGVYGWGYMPEFTDLATGARFRLLHLRPQNQWATDVGRVYPAGYVVGLSGGDTRDTGYPTWSTGQHLCVQTLWTWRAAFPRGDDACR